MNTDRLLKRAQQALARRDVETLRQCARKLHMARHPVAYYYEASAYELEGNMEQAIETLQRGVRARPRDIDRYQDLIQLLDRLERDEEALQFCEAAIEKFEGTQKFTLYAHKIRILTSLERYPEALQAVDDALQLPPPEYRAEYEEMLEPVRLGLLVKLKDHAGVRESLQRLERMAQENPDNPYLISNLYVAKASIARDLDGDIPAARALAQQALQYDRANSAAINILYETGEPVPGTVHFYALQVASVVQQQEDTETPELRVSTYIIAALNKEEAQRIALEYESDALPDATEIVNEGTVRREPKQNAPVGIVNIREEYYDLEDFYA
ncbi:MAG: hypothetical protein ACK4ME_00730 [Fimbriimonadales bacterium]